MGGGDFAAGTDKGYAAIVSELLSKKPYRSSTVSVHLRH